MPPIAVTLLALVVFDLSTYAAHRALHGIPILWRAHRVHHADPLVDVTTTLRQHPIETAVRFLFLLVPSVAFGIPPEAIAIYRFTSVNNGLLEHANVKLWQPLDSVLSLFVVTPYMHKIHHSRNANETDSNY